jgi:Plasmid pRiA4b ORF-3-like protein
MSDVAKHKVYHQSELARNFADDIAPAARPEEMTLHALHRTIQIAFGREDCHLHAFKLHGRHYGTMRAGERHRDAAGREVTLADLQLRVRQRIHYEYDFGDLWEHEIRVERVFEN